MQKFRMLFVVVAISMIGTAPALADSFAGRLGIAARGGFMLPADSKWVGHVTDGSGASSSKIESDAGLAYGGSIISGINKHIAAELEVTHSEFDSKTLGVKMLSFDTTEIGAGIQYRFTSTGPLMPYLGIGLDYLVNDVRLNTSLGIGPLRVDDIVGGHIKGGFDYMISKSVALNAEWKALLAPEANVTDVPSGVRVAKYDPSGFSGLFGLRVFIK